MDEKIEEPARLSAGERIKAAAKNGAAPSALTVMAGAGGSSAAVTFAWASPALEGLNTPQGRARLCVAIETELEGWLASVDGVPLEGGKLCASASISIHPMQPERGDENSLRRLSRIVAPWDEPGWAKLARVLDEFCEAPSLRGRYAHTFSSLGLLEKADEYFGVAPVGLRNVPGLELEDFVAQLEAKAQALALERDTPSAPSASDRKARL